MPKVRESYYQEKKEQILDAAFAVCNRKPAYEVTMSDIVTETKLSQGGVYKYFSNIDEVFSALINRANGQCGYITEIDSLMASEKAPELVIRDLFLFSERYFSDMLIGYNKILFELGTFFAQDPERKKKINKNVTNPSIFGVLMRHVFDIISRQVECGYFIPIIPLNDLFAFIIAAYDGIIRDVTVTKCYPLEPDNPPPVIFNEKSLIQSLYTSIMLLLGKSI